MARAPKLMKRQPFAVVAWFLLSLFSALPGDAESAWFTDSPAAFAEARKTDKIVLVDLFADWCGWCKVMDAEVFSTPAFKQYAERFVLLRVDVEDGSHGSEIQRRFRANSLPTLLLLDSRQALIGSIQGFVETDRLLQRLSLEVRQHDGYVARVEAVLAGSDSESQQAMAKELHGKGDGERAAKLFEKVIATGALTGDELAWAKLQLADSYRMAGRFEDARSAARALKKGLETGSPQSVQISERVDLLLLYIAGGAHDCQNAASALAAFEKGYPKSPYLKDARQAYRNATTDAGTRCS